MKHFSLRALRVLVTVAETGSVSAAATKLSRSQAAISATITELEDAAGIQLFVRKPAKGLAPTAAGEIIVLEARGLLAHADEFESIAGALGNALEGDLSVGCFTNLAPVVFGSLVAKFTERYPRIQVRVELGDQEEIQEALRSGRIETALMFELGLSEQFQSARMAEMPAYAVLPVSHPLANQASVPLAALAPEPLVLMDLPHTREYFLSLFYALSLQPNIKYRSSSFEAVRTMVGNGLGYSVLNLKPAINTTYDGTQVANVPLEGTLPPLHVALVTLRRIAKRRLSNTFHDFARGFLKDWAARQS